MSYYLAALKKYTVFSGRSQRAEYWYFFLFNFIISTVLGFIDRAIISGSEVNIGILGLIFSLIILIPGIAVTIRRLHDIGKSGWMILISFIPIVGFIWLLILMVIDSNTGDNKYGPNPKGIITV